MWKWYGRCESNNPERVSKGRGLQDVPSLRVMRFVGSGCGDVGVLMRVERTMKQ
jgi:hypothetical protein